MDSTLSLQSNLYPHVIPAGAYYAVSSNIPSASRTLLHGLLRASYNETASTENLLAWAQTNDADSALNLLYRLQRLEFLYGDESPSVKESSMTDEQLPELLAQLSSTGRALLADGNGLVRVVSSLQEPYRLICGCKGTAFFLSCKFFRNFF